MSDINIARIGDDLYKVYKTGYNKEIIDVKAYRKQGTYNAHEVACILADVFDDDCACNYNGNDEWLPKYCDFTNKECPNPVGVACWEQYLKHLDKRSDRNEL